MMSNDELPQIQDPYSTTTTTNPNPNPNPLKRKRRSLPGTPDPDAEVIALSPNSLMATNRFICEICNKGFKRDQNLQLHRRGHNLPWKLKKKNKGEVIRKKVFICPEKTCVHHDSSRALGDLTGIKKHYSRKHGEKKWKCDKCSKKYAVMSDWKAHAKICGTREYKCDCGTLFSRKDSFITHRAFCDALVEESARFFTAPIPSMSLNCRDQMDMQNGGNWSFNGVFRPEFGGFESENQQNRFPLWLENNANGNPGPSRGNGNNLMMSEELAQIGCVNQWLSRGQEESFVGGGVLKEEDKEEENKRSLYESISSLLYHSSNNNNDNNNNNQIHYSPVPMSATALLQRAAQIGSLSTSFNRSRNEEGHQDGSSLSLTQMGMENIKNVNLSGVEGEGSLTRDFLGVGGKVNSQDFFSSMMEMRQYNRND